MNVEQLSSISKEDLANAFRAEQERVYEARQARCKGLERKIAQLEGYQGVFGRLQLFPHEVERALEILKAYDSTINLEEKLDPALYAKLKSVESVMDELFPEKASEPEAKKFKHILLSYDKSLRAEFLIPMWERQIANFRRKTPDDMEIQDPTLKVVSKWGTDPGKDTSGLYGKELAGVLWSPFIFRRHIPGMFKRYVRTENFPCSDNVTTVVAGLLKLGKDNPWFALDSQLFSDKPTPEERWKDMYDRLDSNSYKYFEDYSKVGYYYTKRDELAFSDGVTKEELIAESEKILAMSLNETWDLAVKEYKNSDEFDTHMLFGRPKSFDGEFGGDVATFSAFGPKA